MIIQEDEENESNATKIPQEKWMHNRALSTSRQEAAEIQQSALNVANAMAHDAVSAAVPKATSRRSTLQVKQDKLAQAEKKLSIARLILQSAKEHTAVGGGYDKTKDSR